MINNLRSEVSDLKLNNENHYNFKEDNSKLDKQNIIIIEELSEKLNKVMNDNKELNKSLSNLNQDITVLKNVNNDKDKKMKKASNKKSGFNSNNLSDDDIEEIEEKIVEKTSLEQNPTFKELQSTIKKLEEKLKGSENINSKMNSTVYKLTEELELLNSRIMENDKFINELKQEKDNYKNRSVSPSIPTFPNINFNNTKDNLSNMSKQLKKDDENMTLDSINLNMADNSKQLEYILKLKNKLKEYKITSDNTVSSIKLLEKKINSLKNDDIKKLHDFCLKLKENVKGTNEKFKNNFDQNDMILIEIGKKIEEIESKMDENNNIKEVVSSDHTDFTNNNLNNINKREKVKAIKNNESNILETKHTDLVTIEHDNYNKSLKTEIDLIKSELKNCNSKIEEFQDLKNFKSITEEILQQLSLNQENSDSEIKKVQTKNVHYDKELKMVKGNLDINLKQIDENKSILEKLNNEINEIKSKYEQIVKINNDNKLTTNINEHNEVDKSKFEKKLNSLNSKIKELNDVIDTHSQIVQILSDSMKSSEERYKTYDSNFLNAMSKIFQIEKQIKEFILIEIKNNSDILYDFTDKFDDFIKDKEISDQNYSKFMNEVNLVQKNLNNINLTLDEKIKISSNKCDNYKSSNEEKITSILEKLNQVVEYFQKKTDNNEFVLEKINTEVEGLGKNYAEIINEINESNRNIYILNTKMNQIGSELPINDNLVENMNNNVENNNELIESMNNFENLENQYDENDNEVVKNQLEVEGVTTCYASCYATNKVPDLVLKGNDSIKEDFNSSRKNTFLVYSKENNLNSIDSIKEGNRTENEKFIKNITYSRLSPFETIDFKSINKDYPCKNLSFYKTLEGLQYVFENEITCQEMKQINENKNNNQFESINNSLVYIPDENDKKKIKSQNQSDDIGDIDPKEFGDLF